MFAAAVRRRRAAFLLVALAAVLAGCAEGPSTDTDGDGVPDRQDAFPDDFTEVADTDGDGVGDRADADADDDGVPDETDRAPTRDARLNVSLEEVVLLDAVLGSETAHVAFEVAVDDVLVARFPREGAFEVEAGVPFALDENATLDLNDEADLARVTLRALGGPDGAVELDVHPSPDVTLLEWTVNVRSRAIAGATSAGTTSGAGDGGDEPDARLALRLYVPER